MKVLLICNYKPGVGGISGQVEMLQRYLRNDNHQVDVFSTKGSILWRLGLYSRLRKVVREYDVLHVHCCSGWGFMPAVIGIEVGRRQGKRIVLTYHGGGGERFFDKHSKLVRHYLTKTDVNIVLSGFLAQVFEKHRLPYTVIPNIIDLDGSYYRERVALQPHFICTRAHEELYNIPCILRAFRRVQQQVPEATLTLVGDGSQHETLRLMAMDMKLKNVTFTGRVDNSNIYRYLNAADVILSSPKVDNMPVSLLEAMGAGLLVISSKVGGVPYMIKDNDTGLLFENDNDEELADKMIWALNNPDRAISMAKQGHKDVGRYLWTNIKDEILKAYGLRA